MIAAVIAIVIVILTAMVKVTVTMKQPRQMGETRPPAHHNRSVPPRNKN